MLGRKLKIFYSLAENNVINVTGYFLMRPGAEIEEKISVPEVKTYSDRGGGSLRFEF